MLSVVICTWNRADTLDRTLSEMAGLRAPAGTDWELLVVNNKCTDHTDEVIDRHRDRLPIRRLFEPQPGQCHARNRAIDEASGELILWTDDDVLVDADWLRAYADCAARWPGATYFGGKIEPWYECPPPSWITGNLGLFKGMLVVCDRGPEERPFVGEEAPFGANMALRRQAFDTCRFNTSLGLVGASSVRGDETELVAQLRREGHQGVWVPGATVKHLIPAARMTREYLWDWTYGWGRTMVRAEPEGDDSDSRWHDWRLRLNGWRQRLRAAGERLAGRDEWALSYYRAAEIAGMLAERRARRRPPAGKCERQ